MVTTETDRLVHEYLRRLDRELRDVPRARRREIVEDITDHIAEARGGIVDEQAADVRNLLDQLGDPADIAAEASQRHDVPPQAQRTGMLERLALLLLLPGSVLLPVIGWIAGAMMLWMSDAWTTRDKLIGSLVVPGGLLPAILVFSGSITPEHTCDELFDGTGHRISSNCGADAFGLDDVLWLALLSFLGRGPDRQRRVPVQADGPAARRLRPVAGRVGQDRDAVADDRRVGELQRLLVAHVAEQPLAGTQEHREHHHA
jgi:hypothetical protein